MGLITIVRHGQASIDAADYDRLSERGRLQSRQLGQWLAQHAPPVDRILNGPLRRHRQTHAEAASAAAEKGASWPTAEEHPDLTEHQAIAVLDHVLGDQGRNHELQGVTDAERKAAMRRWFAKFDRVMRQWIRQEVAVAHLENWQQARHRTGRALEAIMAATQPGEHVLIFTSGGFLSMALGHLWSIDDETVYEMSLEVHNTAWSQVRVSEGNRRVRSFNNHPHLADPDLLTMV